MTFCHSLESPSGDENPDVFCLNTERSQKAILSDLLGDNSPLIDKVMQSVKKVSL